FANPDLPFYQVQLAPYDKYSNEILPKFWEAQAAAMTIPHTGMALTVDVGEAEDIHPPRKVEVGERLALLALADAYDRTDIYPNGPVVEEVDIQEEGGTVSVRFLNTGDGLKTADDSDQVSGFSLAGEDLVFHPAEARINGNNVVVRSAEVKTPVYIRYAWANFPSVNLVNSLGLPAMPFRTDK
ncbi:MAG: sialate O-acetylesterase, partial [Spirochaetales bacterium]|nr:sialate O-acetylesterase [Spirochaetales bacterium]